jgi:predicted acetyltransferase
MSTSTSDPLRPARLEPGEEFAFAQAVSRHFHEDDSEEDLQRWVSGIADTRAYRAWVSHDGADIVGNLGVFVTTLSLPGGGAVPVTAITAVGVAQTHRRRGLLRGLMNACLDEAIELGEPVASLFASEAPIYGRYGFGVSAPSVRYRLDRAHSQLRDPVDPRLVEPATPQQAVEAFPPVLEALRAQRSGVGLADFRWQLNFGDDPPSKRHGASARRLVHVPGRGYASYRIKDKWVDGLPSGVVRVQDLVATDADAEAALWQHVCDIDLTTTIEAGLRPPDDALPESLVDRSRTRAAEDMPLYTCLLDVRGALTARAYAVRGSTVFSVHDVPGHDDATYRLEVGPDGAECVPTGATPDLELSGADLSAVWLGGVRTTQLLAARRVVEHRPGAAAGLDRLFAVDRAPWTPFIF